MTNIPAVLYHRTDAWDGSALLPLAARIGSDEAAIAEFLRRWPLCSKRQAAVEVSLVFMSGGEPASGQGETVLVIDTAKLPWVEWHMDEDEADGGWVTDSVPTEAIVGRLDDPTIAEAIEQIWARKG